MDALDVTPENMFLAAAQFSNDHDPDKAIAIMQWDGGKRFQVAFLNAGMSPLEMVALLEGTKFQILQSMFNGEPPEPEYVNV